MAAVGSDNRRRPARANITCEMPLFGALMSAVFKLGLKSYVLRAAQALYPRR